jgi:hypothetical protein
MNEFETRGHLRTVMLKRTRKTFERTPPPDSGLQPIQTPWPRGVFDRGGYGIQPDRAGVQCFLSDSSSTRVCSAIQFISQVLPHPLRRTAQSGGGHVSPDKSNKYALAIHFVRGENPTASILEFGDLGRCRSCLRSPRLFGKATCRGGL